MSATPEQLLTFVPESLQPTVQNYWQDWSGSGDSGRLSPNIDLSVMGKVWACSEFVARACIRRPEMLDQLASEGFESGRTPADYQQRVAQSIEQAGASEDELMRSLRQLRQAEMVRIAWRDLAGLAGVEQVLHELSDFAEAVIAQGLQHVYQQTVEVLGVPTSAEGEAQEMLALAMGKLGGRELNFSSDIDLIFAYAEEGTTEGARRLSNHEFFVRMARKLVRLLDEITADGFVFRVDTRLRPNGESGPLAMNFNAMEQYYQLQGRDWERYAMIKAKIIGGREAERKYLASMLRPFTYRRYLDFGAFESIREMKAMIEAEMRRKGMHNNIKLGRGGIREIEFIGQTFQLIRGGPMPELQLRSILEVLNQLAALGYLEQNESEQLRQAYLYLRKLENRLQMERDQQTQTLPVDALSRERIRLAMGCDDWDALMQELDRHRQAVMAVFDSVIAPGEQPETDSIHALQLFWSSEDHTEDLAHWLEQAGSDNAGDLLDVLERFKGSARIRTLSEDGLRRLQQLLIKLLKQLVSYENSLVLLDRVLEILSAIVGRPVYISLLLEYPVAQHQMLELCAASQWFANELARYPILLDELLDSQELFRQNDREQLTTELQRLMSQVDEDDLEQQMERLRHFKRTEIFKLAATDVIHVHEIWDVGAKLSTIADVVLEKVFQLSWDAVCKRHGSPVCIVDGREYHPGMAIVAYGKLGGLETGYGSDLDIVFLHDSSGQKQYTSGEKSIDNTQFFSRVAQKVLHILGTRTHSGILYEADTRLRPDGRAGMMVSSVSAFEDYQKNKAWTWEHQALLRTRVITGSEPVGQEFARIRQSVLEVTRDPAKLCADVVEMREKMRTHLASRDESEFNIKQDRGGMVDIEFTTQAGVLLNTAAHPEILGVSSTLEFIEYLAAVGWYSSEEANNLASAYKLFRQQTNRQALEVELPADIKQKLQPHLDMVTEIWNRLVVSKVEADQGVES
ncbi:MAG: bifunctional [glutamate--ammonia ligase]-adenylyl-L-tyrosine phosphorylase/[glutamate--ammonia-ligase] adenylyltransferase [Thiotrichales bacterium]|nr:MAG: bifunctional [glutamate--ammonia ligase]-adenylyl-L-tyrosine phosphorylase/[glutamate--ammonia-ligase] adenylyltransferase [Thiotrichales bacterium]